MDKEDTTGDRILLDNRWMRVRETTGGWVYQDSDPAVAVLVYKVCPFTSRYLFLLRWEKIPSHGEGLRPWVVFGGVREHGDEETAAVAEIWEEAGIRSQVEELEYLGDVYSRKATNLPVTLFALDASGKTQVDPVGDGSENEKGSKVTWERFEEIVDSPCVFLHSMVLRFFKRYPDRLK